MTRVKLNSEEALIQLGNLDIFWKNSDPERFGYFGLELCNLDDLDGYILLMLGCRWKWPLSYDFYAFGRYWSHYRKHY